MKYATTLLLLAGLVLLGVIIYQTDLVAVWGRLQQVGGWGVAAILAVYLVCFTTGALSWQLTLPSLPANPTWLYRLWKVMMVGEAFNRVLPMASLGGEPVKAVLMKRHYRIAYREATASLVLSHTVFNIALVGFLLCGVLLMSVTEALPQSYRWTAGVSLALFALGILGFFLVQRYKVFSRVGRWVNRGSFGERVHRALDLIHDIEDRLIVFYTQHRGRLLLTLALAFAVSLFGVVEVYLALLFLGHPIGFAEAWVIEEQEREINLHHAEQRYGKGECQRQ